MDEMLDPEMAKAASDARGRPEAELPGAASSFNITWSENGAGPLDDFSGTLAVS
jgi:hypothetical protein